jgi:hypothetical protein
MLHIHFDILGRQNRLRLVQNGKQLRGWQPVIEIVGYPSLQPAKGIISQGSSTIHKSLVDTGNLRHVRMRFNQITIRKREPQMGCRIGREMLFQLKEFHIRRRLGASSGCPTAIPSPDCAADGHRQGCA